MALESTVGQQQPQNMVTNRLWLMQVIYLGPGDLHEEEFDETERTVSLSGEYLYLNITRHTPGHCMYSISTYASSTYKGNTTTTTPVLFSVLVAVIFMLVALTFCVYDAFVQSRNGVVVNAAVRANKLLNSLFPKTVRERLLREMEDEDRLKKSKNMTAKSHLSEFLQYNDRHLNPSTDDELNLTDEKPIADL
jgi:hypothetical protein